ncbi:MAG: HEPN domain-containing protein [Clostridiales bacterium]|nr:HEPN domain-containing protein [Clostridiales bacterium]
MKTEETYRDKAVKNFEVAKLIRSHLSSNDPDDSYINIIGYHLQQSMEFWIKCELMENGIAFPKSHNITQLIMLANDNDVDLNISEYLNDHSEMFTEWESHSRYVMGYRIELKKIDKAIEEISDCFEHYFNSLNDGEIEEQGSSMDINM